MNYKSMRRAQIASYQSQVAWNATMRDDRPKIDPVEFQATRVRAIGHAMNAIGHAIQVMNVRAQYKRAWQTYRMLQNYRPSEPYRHDALDECLKASRRDLFDSAWNSYAARENYALFDQWSITSNIATKFWRNVSDRSWYVNHTRTRIAERYSDAGYKDLLTFQECIKSEWL